MAPAAAAQVTFVLGGTRSGKSAYAERLLAPHPAPVYIATAQAMDESMDARIALHRASRGAHWRTHDAPVELAEAIATLDEPGGAILVDSLTVWLGNLMHYERDCAAATATLVEALATVRGHIVLVASEVGLGITPDNAMARDFVDQAGLLNQAVANAADTAVMVLAGLPLHLKPSSD